MNRLRGLATETMQRHGFEPAFTEALLGDADALRAATTTASEDGPVRDLRGLLWASIDEDTTLDLDQLTTSEPMKDGSTKLWVAIADVDALVTQGSGLDAHAAHNGTSVYGAAGGFPLFPDRLSMDRTSLGEGQDRLALVVEMFVDPTGALFHSDVYRALVKNHAKLSYGRVAGWFEGLTTLRPDASPVRGIETQMQTQDRATRAMRALRYSRGALSLHSSEPRAVFVLGELTDLLPTEPDHAKELIEELMVAANGVIARYLETYAASHPFPSLRRVLLAPQRWPRLVALAASLGHRLPDAPSAGAIAGFLTERWALDPGTFAGVATAVTKLVGRARYEVALPGMPAGGHFGLSVNAYAHATAPNRRFADVVTQRLVKAALRGAPSPYGADQLTMLAAHLNVQEVAAAKVERQVAKSAAALLLANRVAEIFDAVVTGASSKGTWVRILHPSAEGRLIVGFEGLDVGDRVRARLLRTDFESGHLDFGRSEVAVGGSIRPSRSPASAA